MIIYENNFLGQILPAYNNNILKFKSDSLIETVQANVTINGVLYVLYILPNGWFTMNLKEISKTLVNNNNFADTISPDILGNGKSYQENNGWYNGSIAIQIIFIDGSTEIGNLNISLIASVYSHKEFKENPNLPSNNFFLLPLIKGQNSAYYIKYWSGFPFDVIYHSSDNTFDLTLGPTTETFNSPTIQTRFYFSDGRTLQSIENDLPFRDKLNTLFLNDGEKILFVDKIEVCNDENVYIKWFNTKGGYCYWLFQKFYKSSLKISNVGELENDYFDLIDTISPEIQIGKELSETINVETDNLNEDEFNLLTDIFRSPKVWLFNGKQNSLSDINDWLEVKLITSSQTSREWKGQNNKINLAFELPNEPTQKL